MLARLCLLLSKVLSNIGNIGLEEYMDIVLLLRRDHDIDHQLADTIEGLDRVAGALVIASHEYLLLFGRILLHTSGDSRPG